MEKVPNSVQVLEEDNLNDTISGTPQTSGKLALESPESGSLQKPVSTQQDELKQQLELKQLQKQHRREERLAGVAIKLSGRLSSEASSANVAPSRSQEQQQQQEQHQQQQQPRLAPKPTPSRHKAPQHVTHQKGFTTASFKSSGFGISFSFRSPQRVPSILRHSRVEESGAHPATREEPTRPLFLGTEVVDEKENLSASSLSGQPRIAVKRKEKSSSEGLNVLLLAAFQIGSQDNAWSTKIDPDMQQQQQRQKLARVA